MPKFNLQNLDVKKTIETTLDRAKGWLLGTYPSALIFDKKIKIDVRYPGEDISSFGINKNNRPLDLSAQPTTVVIQRGDSRILLKKDSFYNKEGLEKASYVLSIHTPYKQNYRIIETPDGTIKDQGNSSLLWALQKDKDFSSYISFFSKDEKENTQISTQKWDLIKRMTQSREIQ